MLIQSLHTTPCTQHCILHCTHFHIHSLPVYRKLWALHANRCWLIGACPQRYMTLAAGHQLLLSLLIVTDGSTVDVRWSRRCQAVILLTHSSNTTMASLLLLLLPLIDYHLIFVSPQGANHSAYIRSFKTFKVLIDIHFNT